MPDIVIRVTDARLRDAVAPYLFPENGASYGYAAPFDVTVNELKKLGVSPEALRRMTGAPESRIAEIFDLPIEILEVTISGTPNAMPLSALDSGYDGTTLSKYFEKWRRENGAEAARFIHLCGELTMGGAYAD
jgi:hypothetical protein